MSAGAARPDWQVEGWDAEVDAWVDARLRERGRARTGPSRTVKRWSLSAVLEVPVDDGSVFFKAPCAHFRSEAALTAFVHGVDPVHTPRVLAVDVERGWLLMDPLAGAGDDEGDDVPPASGVAVAAALAMVDLQEHTLDRHDDLRAAGAPQRGLAATARDFARVDGAADLAGPVADVLEQLAACGLPEALVHGDLHLGNVAHGGGPDDPVVLYDWTDACLAHPLLDAEVLLWRTPVDERDAVLATFTDRWRALRPDADVDRAVELGRVAHWAFQAVTYDRIIRAIGRDGDEGLTGVLPRLLREWLPEALAGVGHPVG